MIGVVVAGEGSRRRVLGMSSGVRAGLALQAAGVEQVEIVGPKAHWLADSLRRDDRMRIDVHERTVPSSEEAMVVADGIVVDARALRGLAAAAGDAHVGPMGAPCIAHTGSAARSGAPSVEIAVPGVVITARTSAEARDATRALLDSLRKPQDGWISRLLNRRISLAVSRGLAWTGVRPNALSIAILGVGLASAWLAARGDARSLAIGGVLFQAQSVLDGCDGELSRLTFRGSHLGQWLDTIGDDVTNYAFFLGVAIGLHRAGFGDLVRLVGVTGVAIGVVTSAIEYAYLIRVGSGDLLAYPLGFGNDPEPRASPSYVGRVLGALRPAFKRDFFVFLAMLAALAGGMFMVAMVVLFTAGALATCSAVIASEVRRKRAG